jgi:ribonuclease J
VLILATGSQGEPAAALARMAAGEHPQITVGPGDTVIVSASPIPGNEESVARTIDGLFRRGADVIYRAVEPDVHVSGHAAREDLGDLIELLAPRYCVPLHGEYRMMVLYQRLAASRGVPAERVIFPEIGGRLVIAGGRIERDGHVPAGDVLVDGLEIGGIDEAVLRDRRHLAEDGVVIISVAVAGESGELLTSPEVVARGVAQREMAGPVLEAARAAVERALRRLEPNETDTSYLERRIREVARSVIRQQSGRRPLVLPIVTEV